MDGSVKQGMEGKATGGLIHTVGPLAILAYHLHVLQSFFCFVPNVLGVG